MGFDAASAIQRKYAPILEDGELEWKLAIMFTFHCEENRTAKILDTEFRYLLCDLAHEKGLCWLVDIKSRAKGRERKTIQNVLLQKIVDFGKNGLLPQLVELLKKEELGDTPRETLESALVDAADVCGSTGLINNAIALLVKEGVPEKAQARLMEKAEGNAYAEQMKYVDALRKILMEGWASPDLRKGAEAALKKAVESNVREKKMRNIAILLKSRNMPWEIVNMVLEGCPGTGYIEWAADLLKRDDAPQGTREIAKKAVLDGLEFCREGELFGHLVLILRKKGLPESIYFKAIELAGNGEGKHGYGYVDALDDLLSDAKISPGLRNAIEKVLMEGAMERCVKERHGHYVSALRKNLSASEGLRKRACELLIENAGRLSVPPQAPELRPEKLTPGGMGAVDSRFRTPSRKRNGLKPVVGYAPTIRVEVKKNTGKKD